MEENRNSSRIRIQGLELLNNVRNSTDVTQVDLADLHTFKDHPFIVADDVKMAETVESIKKYGVLTPGIVRPRREGGYEIISGHRRKRALELLGEKRMPVMIRNYTDAEATIIMVDSNIQRENILPSEKARAYKMKYAAMSKSKKRGDGRVVDQLARETRESVKTIQRYLRLADLSDKLLDMLDEGSLGIKQAINLSYLNRDFQKEVEDYIYDNGIKLSLAQSNHLRQIGQKEDMSQTNLNELFEKKIKTKKITLYESEYRPYFDETYDEDQIKAIVLDMLKTRFHSN